jgi:hypothetical protein
MNYRVSIQNPWNNQTGNLFFLSLAEAEICQFEAQQFLADCCVIIHSADDLSLYI